MTDKRKVKFNMAVVDYYVGEIVNYVDMPEGQQFWVDHEAISGGIRICEFVEEPKPEIETEKVPADKKLTDEIKDFLKSTDPEPEPELKTDSMSETGLSKDSEPELKKEPTTEPEKETDKSLSFDFKSETKPLCPGKNKDGSSCKRDKLKPNGYCFQHQHQAPTGLTGEAPDNLKDLPGN